MITSGTSLHKIFALSKDKKKSEFNESLDELIKKSVAISGNYAELSYEKSLDYKRISTLLLLFNIESVRRSDGHAQRFPFDQFKHHKGSNVTWSLEHMVFTEMMMIALRIPLLFLKMKRVLIRKIESLS